MGRITNYVMFLNIGYARVINIRYVGGGGQVINRLPAMAGMSSFREKTNDALREWLRSKLLPTHGKKSVLLERYTSIICYFMPYYLSVLSLDQTLQLFRCKMFMNPWSQVQYVHAKTPRQDSLEKK